MFHIGTPEFFKTTWALMTQANIIGSLWHVEAECQNGGWGPDRQKRSQGQGYSLPPSAISDPPEDVSGFFAFEVLTGPETLLDRCDVEYVEVVVLHLKATVLSSFLRNDMKKRSTHRAFPTTNRISIYVRRKVTF